MPVSMSPQAAAATFPCALHHALTHCGCHACPAEHASAALPQRHLQGRHQQGLNLPAVRSRLDHCWRGVICCQRL
jgi:hypothetical protein